MISKNNIKAIEHKIGTYTPSKSIATKFSIMLFVVFLLFVSGCGNKNKESVNSDVKDNQHIEMIDLGYGLSKDKDFVYKDGVPIHGFDPETFEMLDKGYSKDKNGVYSRLKRVDEADPDTFEIIGDGFSKDKNGVYKSLRRVDKADLDTFQLIGGGFAKDKNNIYLDNALNYVDIESFEILDWHFAKDKDTLFWHCKNLMFSDYDILENINLADIVAVSDKCFKDKNNVYIIETGMTYEGIRRPPHPSTTFALAMRERTS